MELKEILGEDLYNQVQEAVKGKGQNGKDIELVAANTGDYVPAKKYDELKASLAKISTDYATLDSKYNTDVISVKQEGEKTLKNFMLETALGNANIAKVNNSYAPFLSQFKIDDMKLEGSKLIGLDEAVSAFVTANPNLVVKTTADTQPGEKDKEKIPPASGVNPVTSGVGVKDRAFYVSAYKEATDLTAKMAIKREAAENGILI